MKELSVLSLFTSSTFLSFSLQSTFHPHHLLKQCLSVTDHTDFHAVKSHSYFSGQIKHSLSLICDIFGHCLPLEKFCSLDVYETVLLSSNMGPSFSAPLADRSSSSSACWNALSPAVLPMQRVSSGPVDLNGIIFFFYASDSQTFPCPLKSQFGIKNLTWPKRNS